jgi:SulP family sulfate permease
MRLLLRWLRSRLPERRFVRADALAGLPAAIGSVPDGMAASVLAGVSPFHGLYACFAGPIAGGLSASTKRMMITTTSAAALAAGSALQAVPPARRENAILLLTLLTGAVMIAAGLAKLGRYTRFVSNSVMLGFLTGVAVNIVLGQLPALLGAPAVGATAVAKVAHVIAHPGTIEPASLACGMAALVLLAGLARTPLRTIAPLLALAVPTVAVVLLDADSVARVEDIGAIPSGVPVPELPDLGLLSFDLLLGAVSIAAIVLVQGAGVREAAPNLDGPPSRVDGDFIAQGIGNLAAGLFRGQPVGGSVGTTTLAVSAGARTRWTAIFAGLWMLVILVACSGLVGQVAMPTLGAVLVFAGLGAIRHAALATVVRAGGVSRVALITTFVATLALPIAAAVGIGVALSLMLQLNQEAVDLRVVQLVPDEDGTLRERPAPRVLPSGRAVLLEAYGSLLFAGARTLQSRLPDPAGAQRPAVVLRLRGRVNPGTTLVVVLGDYREQLEAAGGRLYLGGVDPELAAQLERAGTGAHVFPATDRLGESSVAAFRAAEAWARGGAG